MNVFNAWNQQELPTVVWSTQKELQTWEVVLYIDKTDVAIVVVGGGGDNHTQNQFLPHIKHGSPPQEQSVCYVRIISPYCTVLYCTARRDT